MGKHKKLTCGKCLRIMRSDYLKTHMLQHEKEKFEKETICSSSIATSKASLKEEMRAYLVQYQHTDLLQ